MSQTQHVFNGRPKKSTTKVTEEGGAGAGHSMEAEEGWCHSEEGEYGPEYCGGGKKRRRRQTRKNKKSNRKRKQNKRKTLRKTRRRRRR